MTKITLIRLLIAIVALQNIEIHQMDIKAIFLNGELETIHLEQREGFIAPNQEKSVQTR